MEGEKKGLNAELWLACAGPLVTLPAVGSRVVYFPQGHSEQVAASTQKEVDAHIPNYPNLPPQLICQLHNVTLHADLETDEVYAQMTLQPIPGQEKASFMTSDLGRPNKQPNEHFCKTLTASDTSTHGGFSIPRRAAEKVFPPLDFSQQPPAQEIIARDLHDVEWHFRHIYRGQPRRHLLTTGWSVFVSAKRLQAGDSVLFIRDEKNQILLGIRRANRQQPSAPSSFLSSDSMHIGVLAAAAHAHATSSRFTIFYNPRASPSEFVIPLSKYQKAIYGVQVSVGMRFRMQFETEDASTRRYTGTITGIGDLDPVRWPNSCWRSLKVGWDESTAGERQQRVSLWEIEPFTTPFLICSPSLSLRARCPRLPGEEEDMEANLRKATALWMRGENTQNMNLSMEHWMHLQQRNDIIASPHSEYYRTMAAAALQEIRNSDSSKQLLQVQNQQALQSQQMQFLTQYQQQLPPLIQQQQNMHQQQAQNQTRQHQHAHHHLSQNQLAQQTINSEPKAIDLPPLKGSGFVESEINSIAPPSMPVAPSIISRSQAPMEPERSHSHFPTVMRQDNAVAEHSRLLSEAVQDPQISNAWFSIEREASQLENRPGSYPIPHSDLAGQNNLSNLPLHLFGVNIDSPLTSANTSISMNKQKDMPNQFSGGTLLAGAVCSSSNTELPINSSMVINSSIDDNGILQPSSDQQQYQAAVRTFTKVYKLGSVGRSLDITRLRNYEELKRELARMFGLEGQLEDPFTSIWQLVFIDNESDILLVGDDPWDEFVSCVRCIHIMSQSEVLQMNQKQMELLTTPIRRPAFGNCDNTGDLPGSMEQ